MKYADEMASRGRIHIPSFMKTGAGIQAISRFCLRNLRGCVMLVGFMKCTTEMDSGDIIYVPSSVKIGSGI
jgi:hypothetical protein